MSAKKNFPNENAAVVQHPDYSNEIAAIARSNLTPRLMREKIGDYHENDIADALELARQKGYTLATLLVSLEKPALMEYYKQIGFFPMGRLRFMGQEHQKMAISI